MDRFPSEPVLGVPIDRLRDSEWVLREIFAGRATSDQLYGWVRRRRIPHVKIGRRLYFSERRLGEFIAQGGLDAESCPAERRALR